MQPQTSRNCKWQTELTGEKNTYKPWAHGHYSSGTCLLLIHYSISLACITHIVEIAASWIFLQNCLLKCNSPHSPLTPLQQTKYYPLHRVVSSPPGHAGSAQFVDLILVWCCLSSQSGLNDSGSAGRAGPFVQRPDNTSPPSLTLWSESRWDAVTARYLCLPEKV